VPVSAKVLEIELGWPYRARSGSAPRARGDGPDDVICSSVPSRCSPRAGDGPVGRDLNARVPRVPRARGDGLLIRLDDNALHRLQQAQPGDPCVRPCGCRRGAVRQAGAAGCVPHAGLKSFDGAGAEPIQVVGGVAGGGTGPGKTPPATLRSRRTVIVTAHLDRSSGGMAEAGDALTPAPDRPRRST